ncbi:MAG: pilus assembly protein PilM, partial [Planctomycetaceae bacterium]
MSSGSRFFRSDSSADYVALDWESAEVRLAAARVGGGRMTLLGAARAELPAGADGKLHQTAAADSVRRAWGTLPVKSPRALLVLPRDLVVVRKLDLPTVPDNELPDLVRLQAATKLATPVDRLALDYLPLAAAPESLGRSVLLVSADQERLQGIVAAARQAGLEPVGAVTSTISVAELALRCIDSSSGLILVAWQHRQRLELFAMYERVPIFSYSLTLPEGDAAGRSQLLRAELSRVQVAVRQAQH